MHPGRFLKGFGGPGAFWGHLGGLGGALGVQVGFKSPQDAIFEKLGPDLGAKLGPQNSILC